MLRAIQSSPTSTLDPTQKTTEFVCVEAENHNKNTHWLASLYCVWRSRGLQAPNYVSRPTFPISFILLYSVCISGQRG